MLHVALASKLHRGNTAMCNREAKIAILAVPGVKNTPHHPKTCAKNTLSHDEISVIMTKRVLDKEGCCHPCNKTSVPFPRPLKSCGLSSMCRGASLEVQTSAHARQQQQRIDNTSHTSSTLAAPSHHGSSTLVDRDIVYVIIHMSLLCCSLATIRQGCADLGASIFYK
jgi:hypothetical protein